jgi:hypothetical protein
MKKFSFKVWIEKIQLVAQRFPFTLFFLLGLAFLFFLQINKHGMDIQPHTWTFFSLGIILSLTVSLFSEDFKFILLRGGLNLVGILLLLGYCYTLPAKFLSVNFYQTIALGIVFVLSTFVGSFLKKNNDISFWEFGKKNILQLVITFIFAQVLMLGLSLAVLSLKELFKIDVQHEVYQNLAVVCYAIFAPLYFLTTIPNEIEKRKQEYTFEKFLKILGLYILLPILALYTLILYVYLIQIVIKWELPNGWVSTLVSVLGLGGFLCMLILYPLRLEKENKIVNFLSKNFPLLLFPLLVLMTIGIFRRLDDYGLTVNRLYVMLLNFWLYGISIYLFISKANHLKWIIISFATILLFSSVGPLSVFSITKHSMIRDVKQLLTDAHLLKNGKVIDNSNAVIKVDSVKTVQLSAKISYTLETYGQDIIQPFFSDSIQKLSSSDIEKRLGLNEKYLSGNSNFRNSTETQYFNASLPFNEASVDIKDYNSYLRIRRENDAEEVYKGNDFVVKYHNNTLLISKPTDKQYAISIPLKMQLKKIFNSNKKGTDYTMSELSLTGPGYLLIINNLNGFHTPKSDSITITNLHASLFLK